MQKDLKSGKFQKRDIDIGRIAKIGLDLFTKFTHSLGDKLGEASRFIEDEFRKELRAVNRVGHSVADQTKAAFSHVFGGNL